MEVSTFRVALFVVALVLVFVAIICLLPTWIQESDNNITTTTLTEYQLLLDNVNEHESCANSTEHMFEATTVAVNSTHFTINIGACIDNWEGNFPQKATAKINLTDYDKFFYENQLELFSKSGEVNKEVNEKLAQSNIINKYKLLLDLEKNNNLTGKDRYSFWIQIRGLSFDTGVSNDLSVLDERMKTFEEGCNANIMRASFDDHLSQVDREYIQKFEYILSKLDELRQNLANGTIEIENGCDAFNNVADLVN